MISLNTYYKSASVPGSAWRGGGGGDNYTLLSTFEEGRRRGKLKNKEEERGQKEYRYKKWQKEKKGQ